MAATAIRRARRLAAPLVLSLSLVLAACGEDGAGSAVVQQVDVVVCEGSQLDDFKHGGFTSGAVEKV